MTNEEQLAKSIMDAQPESVIWFQPVGNTDAEEDIADFEIRYCNDATARLFGIAKENLIGQSLSRHIFLDEKSQKKTFEQCLEVYHSGKSQEFTIYVESKDRYYLILRSKVLGGIISVARDNTSIVLSEQRLKKQADLLNGILDTSTNAVFACEAIHNDSGEIIDFRLLKVNRMFLELTHETELSVVQKTCLEHFPPAKENGLFDWACTVVHSGESIRRELKYSGAGLETWLDISMARLNGTGLVITFTVITERKKDKAALLNSAQYLQHAIDASQTGITVIAPVWSEENQIIDFKYRVVNKTFSEVVGGSPSDLNGTLLSRWFPLYKAQGTFDRYVELYNTGVTQRFDLHYVKDGYDVWVDVMAKREGSEIFVTFHDFTTIKNAQLKQEALVNDLKRSNANLEDFAFAASHDLQEPLRKIHFFSHKLRNEYISLYDNEGVNLFLRMEAATQRMRELINDLLDYSQLNREKEKEEKVDLNKVVKEVLIDLETVIQEKRAQFTIDRLPEITGEASQLRQLFQNLISNALKYSHPGTEPFVAILTKKLSGRESGFSVPPEALNQPYHLLEITDNGIGFDQADAEKIFNVFQRLHSREEYAGTGVGLAIVKKVVDNHKGFISATSNHNEGATFRLVLPAI